MIKVRNLCPDAFSLDDLDKELVAMTMIRALPDSYSSFASSLQLLDKLDKDTLQSAFVNEEALRNRSSTSGSTALSASTPSAAVVCAFCGLLGHLIDSCHRFARAKEQATQDAQEKKKQRNKGKSNAPATSNAAAAKETAALASNITEFAGQASVRLSSHSITPDDPAYNLWTADTGATSHMTPTSTGFAATPL